MTKNEKIICGFILVFLSGILWPSLPQITLTTFVVFILLICVKFKCPPLLIGMIGGFVWHSVSGHFYLYWQLDPQFYHQNLVIEGEVKSLMPPTAFELAKQTRVLTQSEETGNKPQSKSMVGKFPASTQTKFNFVIQKAGTKPVLLAPVVRLSWFNPSLPLQQGDKLKLFVKLKPAIGLANPDGFDYQTWLVSKSIVGLGYVKDSPSNQFLKQKPTLRQQWVNRLLAYKLSHIKWILALTYGDRHLLATQDWALMQRTGTAHLFAISGMHLGIVFGFVLLISKGVLASLMYFQYITLNLKSWLLVCPSVICIGYAQIAGFEIPVLRALLTVLLWTMLAVCSLYWRTSSVLIFLLLTFFILFPFSILGISFWFSFISVMLIIFYVWRFPLISTNSFVHKIVYAIKLQLFISIVTLPIIAYTFSSLPLIAFIANLFMIPIVTFVLVPLCLLAAIMLGFGAQANELFWFINECFAITFWVLNKVDTMSASILSENWQKSNQFNAIISVITHPFTIIFVIICLLPAWPRKQTLLTCIILWQGIHQIIHKNFSQVEAAWAIYAMDVGQGSAIVLIDSHGVILSDTGGSFAGFSMAKSVLMPFFKAKGINTLHYVLLSHFDNDHAGGIDFIKKELQVNDLLSPRNACNREDFLLKNPTGKGKLLTFSVQILWPLKPSSGNENNQSCVIKLEKNNHSILLTGDIEKEAEAQLVALYQNTEILKADILVAPHHGSKTSSSVNFVKAVRPQHVIFTSGNHNRWGFPSQEVVNRYQGLKANILITGKQGRIKLNIEAGQIAVSKYRIDEYKRWYFSAR